MVRQVFDWLQDEIQQHIINTYTPNKKFNYQVETINKSQSKIKNLSDNYFTDALKLNDSIKLLDSNDIFQTLKLIYDSFNEFLYFRIRDNKLVCAFHIFNLKNNIDWLKYIKYKDQDNKITPLEQNLMKIIESSNKNYYTLRKPHYLPTNSCVVGLDSDQYF